MRALKSRTGVTTKLRVRLLGANGISTAEKELTISESWQSLRQICHNQSIDLSTVSAMQVLQTTDGYVFYHNGFVPDAVYTAGTYPVLAGMDTDTEAPLQDLLLAGEIMGEVSYTRPMGTYYGQSDSLSLVFAASALSNLAAGASITLTDSSSRLLVAGTRPHVLHAFINLQDPQQVKLKFDFRVRRLPFVAAVGPGAWSEFVSIFTVDSDSADVFNEYHSYEAPPFGLYGLEVRLTNLGTTAIPSSAGVSARMILERYAP